MGEGYLAEIRIFSSYFAPEGWMFCKGQVLPIAQNTALFSLLGTTFGGDGRTTFSLPTLPDPGDGLKYIICVYGIYPSRPG